MADRVLDEIDIHDRVFEAYYGAFGESMMEKTQERIHWICAKVRGSEVLDVGCSQGILPLLLGREGKRVTGLDISAKAIDEANAHLQKEEIHTKENISFLHANFMTHDFKNLKYETIIIAEVLEHLTNPKEFVDRAASLLKESGTLIITVPFGINDFIDHKQTFYLLEPLRMLQNDFIIEDIWVLGKWIGFVAQKSEHSCERVDESMPTAYIQKLEESFYEIERLLLSDLKKKSAMQLESNVKYKETMEKLIESNRVYGIKKEQLQRAQKELEQREAELAALSDSFESKKELYEEEIQELQRLHNTLVDANSSLQSQVNIQKTITNGCKESISFKLGHLLIHETKSFKDILQIVPKILELKRSRTIKKESTNTQKPKETKQKFALDAMQESKKNGVSVVIPSFKGQDTILKTLESFGVQDFSKEKFELIVVLNGERDSSEDIIRGFASNNPSLNIVIEHLLEAGASRARNHGVERARYKYLTFVDDDDTVSPNFLSSLFHKAAPETIVVSQIVNFDSDGVYPYNPINSEVLKFHDNENMYKLSSLLTITACKLIPTATAQMINFDETLKSGEDVVYFSELFSSYDFSYRVAKEAIYFRLLQGNSLSRQPLSYEFNVSQRLDVIQKLFKILNARSLDKSRQAFVNQKVFAQISFINRYLEEYPQSYSDIVKDIQNREMKQFPLDRLYTNAKTQDRELVVSYCYTPYVDTSAIVMAKRVYTNKKNVAVIYNDMAPLRKLDLQLEDIAKEYVKEKYLIEANTSFSNWKDIETFCNESLKAIGDRHYSSLYSRVMWPASHFGAFLFKLRHPETFWSAEFSDPILLDIHGDERYSKITTPWYFNEIEKWLKEYSLAMPKSDNLFFWCEFLAFVFADEIIFTNENQQKYMLMNFDEQMQNRVLSKSKIVPHPTLPHSFYGLFDSRYTLNANRVNIAYFGTFYKTRNFDELVTILESISRDSLEKLLIHVFTDTKDELKEMIATHKLEQTFVVNEYVGYLEFLSLTDRFECLLLNDAQTKENKPFNPYLPSKLSDYLGSSTPVWLMYEEGSVASREERIRYKSEIGNIKQSCSVLEEIIGNCHRH